MSDSDCKIKFRFIRSPNKTSHLERYQEQSMRMLRRNVGAFSPQASEWHATRILDWSAIRCIRIPKSNRAPFLQTKIDSRAFSRKAINFLSCCRRFKFQLMVRPCPSCFETGGSPQTDKSNFEYRLVRTHCYGVCGVVRHNQRIVDIANACTSPYIFLRFHDHESGTDGISFCACLVLPLSTTDVSSYFYFIFPFGFNNLPWLSHTDDGNTVISLSSFPPNETYYRTILD